MSFRASRFLIVVATLAIVCESSRLGYGQSSQCACPEPPGGSVTCEKRAVPICKIKDGKVVSICKELPPEVAGREGQTVVQENAWLLSVILGKPVAVADLRKNADYQKALFEARLTAGDATVTFVPFTPSVTYLPAPVISGFSFSATPNGENPTTASWKAGHGFLPDSHYKPLNGVGPEYESLYARGIDSLKGAEYEDAIAAFQSARQVATSSHSVSGQAEAYYGEGTVYLSAGRFAEARESFTAGIRMAPYIADLYAGLGSSEYALGQFSEAAQSFSRAIAFQPNSYVAYVGLGSAQLQQRNYVAAYNSVRSALALKPDDPEINSILGLVFLAQGKYGEAKKAFTHSIELNPKPAIFFGNLAAANLVLGQYAEAEIAIRKAIELKADYSYYHSELGRILYAQVRYAEAEQAFRNASKLAPQNPLFHAALGDALYAQDKRVDAKAEYRRAVTLDSQSALYLNKLKSLAGPK